MSCRISSGVEIEKKEKLTARLMILLVLNRKEQSGSIMPGVCPFTMVP